MTGYVYAVKCGGAVKLGWSKDPTRRLDNLAIGNPEECRLIATIPETIEQERELHLLLAEHRIRGEWFHLRDEVEYFVSHMDPYAARETDDLGSRLRRWRIDNKVSLEALGQRIGATKSFLAKIERGSAYPSISTMVKLINATSGAVSATDFLPTDTEAA